jgi:hypothetical protein
MKALVGGGIQRKQRTGMTLRTTAASSARQRNRRSRESLVLFDSVAELMKVAFSGIRGSPGTYAVTYTLSSPQDRVKMKGGYRPKDERGGQTPCAASGWCLTPWAG